MTVTVDLFRNEADRAEAVPAGHVLFAEGTQGEMMYVVLEGEVELRVRGQVVDRVGPGGVLGEMSLIDPEPRAASAVTVTPCKLVHIDKHRFMFLVQQTPHFALQIMRVIADRLRRMNARL